MDTTLGYWLLHTGGEEMYAIPTQDVYNSLGIEYMRILVTESVYERDNVRNLPDELVDKLVELADSKYEYIWGMQQYNIVVSVYVNIH